MDEEKLRILRETGHYLTSPRGVSMYPMLREKKDIVDIVPINQPLKKYDVVIYYRPTDNNCVIHRYFRQENDCCIIYGDNCRQKEVIPQERVFGVVSRFYRNGKWISPDNKGYRLYVHLWCDFLPVRRAVFRVRDKLKRRKHNEKQKRT